jgi:trafficking protein particle complex subunit 9
MDPLDFGSLAHIRILLLPVGSITHAAFKQWAAEIKSFDNIRLSDIPADAREDRGKPLGRYTLGCEPPHAE